MLINITAIVIDTSGNTSEFSQPLIITRVNKELHNIPKEFRLSQNYPNPCNPTTNFEFAIAKDVLVTLKVYNILGEEVVTIVNKELPAGNFVDTKKLILLR